ncbi:hypothetical protein [Ralstonia mojiangensis]|uniref:hypothetical protein n=1 Tax=Ralstonia mojiangensis TaxID=2953895 RepID=UPI0021B3B657|nr:hypothetical protein [Ralstonia mojiangensis]MCT7327998.1 hypothetical protein [Ralstonia mojiangensis]
MSESVLSQLVGQLLGNREVIVYWPALARALGDAEATLFLCQACYWQSVAGPGQWFYKLRDAERDACGNLLPPTDARRQSWEWETALSRTRQESARRRLKELGLLEEVLQGVPARLHYRVPFERVAEFLLEHRQLAGFPPTGWQSSHQQEGGYVVSKSVANPPAISETTTQPSITTTTTTPSRALHARGGSGALDVQQLALHPVVDRHRGILFSVLQNSRLTLLEAQQIVDELAGLLEAQRQGRHRGISGPSPRGWLVNMVRRAHVGEFVFDLGKAIEEARKAPKTSPSLAATPTDRSVGQARVRAIRNEMHGSPKYGQKTSSRSAACKS